MLRNQGQDISDRNGLRRPKGLGGLLWGSLFLPLGLLIGIAISSGFNSASEANDALISGVNLTADSAELSNLDELSEGYHRSLSKAGEVFQEDFQNLGTPLSRQELLSSLGAPEQCLSPSPPRGHSRPTILRSEQHSFGLLHWIEGRAECRGFSIPWQAIVGLPEQPPKGVLILIHGTASSPEQLFNVETGSYHPDYSNGAGEQALLDGFAVIAPRLITDLVYDSASGYNLLRGQLDRRAQVMGVRLVGLEQVALTGLLSQVTEYFQWEDLKSVIYGVSLGGSVAFYQAAANPLIDAVIVSQWTEDRYEKLASDSNPWAMWRYEDADYTVVEGSAIELTDERVAQLIAPRPFGVEVGLDDPRAVAMEPVIARLEELYVRTPRALQISVVSGGHEMFYSPIVEDIWSVVRSGK